MVSVILRQLFLSIWTKHNLNELFGGKYEFSRPSLASYSSGTLTSMYVLKIPNFERSAALKLIFLVCHWVS